MCIWMQTCVHRHSHFDTDNTPYITAWLNELSNLKSSGVLSDLSEKQAIIIMTFLQEKLTFERRFLKTSLQYTTNHSLKNISGYESANYSILVSFWSQSSALSDEAIFFIWGLRASTRVIHLISAGTNIRQLLHGAQDYISQTNYIDLQVRRCESTSLWKF